ncbi:DUF1542 domain-containing protein [Staphylococcus saccharolyticus]|uniref:DUF1542 domain-containing protein n=1 Tax=Staphylococcus saccharolyticus TaxID=33028 RepID=UPI0013EE66BF|nr:DUF1542 domain-containing protein [Staphylococcus saccharolyticus]MBL7573206.1 DUF1542 domain-containing protein [Staphylococcus saccharolyticus]MBL7583860.1 DUF1542 domain-containing protein [Staphylococcus saccharolyticus]MBL7638822.1 DUF1542 domain-containing protein [Staphylococcus saccharolyticus]QRJ67696.1 DUF1542 domain-containing protein [Staphylococcus saccharolyticus]
MPKAKIDAKQAITDLAKRKRDAIQNNTDLTASQKAHALAEIDKAEKEALQHITNADSIKEINDQKDNGLSLIAHVVIWDIDQEPIVLHHPELSLQNVLVTGKVTVHRDPSII